MITFKKFSTVQEFLTAAAAHGVIVEAADVDISSHGDLFVDDMNAEEWLEIMVQD